MRHHLHQPRSCSESQKFQPQSSGAFILRNRRRNALVQQPRRLGEHIEIRRAMICGWMMGSGTVSRLCGWCDRFVLRILRDPEERQNREETNEFHAGKPEALNNKRNAAPTGSQQIDRSGRSHVTRMGPTPGLTQILSSENSKGACCFRGGGQGCPAPSSSLRAGSQSPGRRRYSTTAGYYTSHKSAAFRSEVRGSPVGTNSCATNPRKPASAIARITPSH